MRAHTRAHTHTHVYTRTHMYARTRIYITGDTSVYLNKPIYMYILQSTHIYVPAFFMEYTHITRTLTRLVTSVSRISTNQPTNQPTNLLLIIFATPGVLTVGTEVVLGLCALNATEYDEWIQLVALFAVAWTIAKMAADRARTAAFMYGHH